MDVREIKAKSIITERRSAFADYAIDPYIGCGHGCVYCSCHTQPGSDRLLRVAHKSRCYAGLMGRFTGGLRQEERFVAVKANAAELVPKGGLRNKRIALSSMTDPYQPLEEEYMLTRRILERLAPLRPAVRILTKSGLVARDFDVLEKFGDCAVGVSVSAGSERVRREIEPCASPVRERLRALEGAKEHGLGTFVFVSPILPGITDCRKIVGMFDGAADEFFFENLDLQGVWGSVRNWLADSHPGLVKEYERVYFTENGYWRGVRDEIMSMADGRRFNTCFNRGAL